MPHISPEDINRISDFESLLAFLHDKLDWPIDPSKTIEDVTLDYLRREGASGRREDFGALSSSGC